MNIAAIWMGLPKWVRDAVMIFGAVLAVILLGKQYVKGKQDEAVRKNNEKRDRESAEAEREVITNITENTNEAVRQSDAVRSIPAARELPDGTATLEEYHYRDQGRGVEGGAMRNRQRDSDIS
jgi:hypothetical protein